MNAGTSSSDLVHLAYRLLNQYPYYDKVDLSLHANVTAYEVGDSFQQRQEHDYAAIIAVACKVPEKILQEDSKVLMWYDQALARTGGESWRLF